MSRKTLFFWTHLIFLLFLMGPIVLVIDTCIKILSYPPWTAYLYIVAFSSAAGWFGWLTNPFEED